MGYPVKVTSFCRAVTLNQIVVQVVGCRDSRELFGALIRGSTGSGCDSAVASRAGHGIDSRAPSRLEGGFNLCNSCDVCVTVQTASKAVNC